MRVDKYVSQSLSISRTQARKLIAVRRVFIDGAVCESADLQVSGGEVVALDGATIARPGHVHIIMNKPAGLITAMEDARAGTVADILPRECILRGVTPVGRLDKDVTGILLFTTDGQLAHRLISPKYDVAKVYIAKVERDLTQSDINAFAAGMVFKDFTARPATLDIIDPRTARVTISEGKYHQVKRMFIAIGSEVASLKRVRFAGIDLPGDLPVGEYMTLPDAQIDALYAQVKMERP